MATESQIAANRLNALKSTGPRTVEGKLRSRSNALVHGMSGTSGFVENGMMTAFEARRAEWVLEYRPEGETSAFVMDRLVAASLRIEQCERAFDAIIERHSLRADRVWKQDAQLEAANLAAKLSKDPMRVARALRANRHGCELIIELWSYLGNALQAKRDWSEAETVQALNLLGVPLENRDSGSPLNFPADEPRFDQLHTLINREIHGLQALIEGQTSIDELDREHAKAGDIALLSQPALLIARYERDAWRRFRDAAKTLRTAEAMRMNDPGFSPAPTTPTLPKTAPAPTPHVQQNEKLENETEADATALDDYIRKIFAESEERRAKLVEGYEIPQYRTIDNVLNFSASRAPMLNGE